LAAKSAYDAPKLENPGRVDDVFGIVPPAVVPRFFTHTARSIDAEIAEKRRKALLSRAAGGARTGT
jgi:hypothetical protein